MELGYGYLYIRNWNENQVRAGSGDDTITLTGIVESKAYDNRWYSGYFGNGKGYGRIYGEDGNDTIDASKTTFAYDIYGGTGDDIIYGAQEYTKGIHGGAGDDTITSSKGQIASNSWSSIDGGDGNDTITSSTTLGVPILIFMEVRVMTLSQQVMEITASMVILGILETIAVMIGGGTITE